MQVSVLSESGKKAGAGISVSDVAFAAKFNEPLVHQIVIAHLAAARSGTRAQKNRAAVSGGGAKPWRQKGTGRARAGTIRSPLWRGGGVVFPSQTEDFSQKVNRKMYRGALRAILSELLRQERLVVVEDFAVAAPKTKALTERLAKLGVADVLIVSERPEQNLMLSARNLPYVEVCDVAGADPVRLVGHDKVVMTVGAVKKFEEMLR